MSDKTNRERAIAALLGIAEGNHESAADKVAAARAVLDYEGGDAPTFALTPDQIRKARPDPRSPENPHGVEVVPLAYSPSQHLGTFGTALEAMKAGQRVRRAAWPLAASALSLDVGDFWGVDVVATDWMVAP